MSPGADSTLWPGNIFKDFLVILWLFLSCPHTASSLTTIQWAGYILENVLEIAHSR